MASQLLRIISAMHANQVCHGHIGGSSLVLTDGAPSSRPAHPPFKVIPSDPLPPAAAPPGHFSTLSPPTSGLSTTEESDCESADGMSSWLLPGYPQAVDHHDVRKAQNSAAHHHTPGSPSEALLRASTSDIRTPPRRCEGGAVSEATPVGEGRDRRHSATRPSPASRRKRQPPPTRNTLSVNETFEGLASASVMSAISTRMVIPIRSMRHEIEQRSVSDSAASQSMSVDLQPPAVQPSTGSAPAEPRPRSTLLSVAGPVAEGADGGALGGTSSISWDAQVSDIIDQQLDMFAPASAALGLMPSIANEPGMYKAAASAFEDGCDKPGTQNDDSDAQMNTRWSFEADVAAEVDEAEIARVFGEDTVKPMPPPPVRTTSRASSSKPPRKAPTRAHVQSSAARRQLYDAVMEAGAEKYGGGRGTATRAPSGTCKRCAEMGQACADCQLRGANQRISRARDRRVQPGPAAAGKRRAGEPGGGTGARKAAPRPVTDESGVHVMLHLHGASEMPAVGGARLFAIHKDVAAAGAALLLAVTGEDMDVYHLQRALETKRPLSRKLAWTMLSAEARDFMEGLLGERIGLEDAYRVRPRHTEAPLPYRSLRSPIVHHPSSHVLSASEAHFCIGQASAMRRCTMNNRSPFMVFMSCCVWALWHVVSSMHVVWGSGMSLSCDSSACMQHPWMRQHFRRAQVSPERVKRAPRKPAPKHPQAVIAPEPTLKSARRKSPLSVASSAHPSSPLTIQPVRKPSPGMKAQRSSSGPASPRLPRRESGASIAQSRNPSHQNLSRRTSQNSLVREPSQGAPARDPAQGGLSRNPSHGNLARAESSGGSARFRRSDSMSLIAPHRSASGSAPTPSRVPSDSNIATPALAQRITEERVDDSGKRHVVTRFVLPPRAPSNAAQQLSTAASEASGTPPPASMQSMDALPSERFSAAEHSSEMISGAGSTASSVGLLSQPLLQNGERSDMLPAPQAQIL